MRSVLKKGKRGVAGLNILLSVVTMLFIIGLLVMIYALLGGELQESVSEEVTNNVTAVGIINDTTNALSNTTDFFSIIVVITVMVVLILLTVIIIQAIRTSGIMAASA